MSNDAYLEWMSGLDPATQDRMNGFYGQQPYDRNNPYGNINPYAYSNMSPEDMPADKLLAQLTRAQLRDYRERFEPVENQLVASITPTGTTQIGADLDRTRSAVLDSADNVRGQSNRFRERYGLSAMKDTAGRANATTSALVGGLNATRAVDAERRDAIIAGGLSTVGQQTRGLS